MFHIRCFLFLKYLADYDKKLYETGYVGSLEEINKFLKNKTLLKNKLYEFPNILFYLKESNALTYSYHNDEYEDHYENIKLTNKGIHYLEFTLISVFKYLFSNVVIPAVVAFITTLITLKLSSQYHQTCNYAYYH